MEGDGARVVCGKVSGVGLVDGMSGSRLPDMTVSAGMIRRKAIGEKSRLLFACFGGSVFNMALVGCNEHADLR